MYLSEIEIFGFKSFAVKTPVKFTPGMTAIVGPNGCGKTNVVDALRWVLGEQKASTLRSDKMHDVIFNGTKNRRPLGLAEVSLTVQNNRGVLPTEYSAVKITRRLFRSGESQYLLNGTECRLRDITDLFMDTGMGPDAYSVIELKMIETILSNRTDERRRLFEEAAGVTKYKTRRREAERKLETIQGDLSRINDIVVEVQKVVRSLSRQAAKAKLAAEIGGKLRNVERVMLQHEYAQLLRLAQPLEQGITTERAAKERYEQELQDAEAVLAKLEAQQNEIQSRLQAAESAFVEAQRRQMSASQERAVANERLIALERSRERALKDAAELKEAIAQAEIRLAENRAALDASERDLEQAESAHASLKAIADEISAQAQTARANARTANDAVMSLLNQINAVRADSERTIAALNALRQRKSETERAMQQQQEKLLLTQRDHEASQQLGSEHELRVRRAEDELRIAQETTEALQAEISAMERDSASLQADLSRKTASLEFLQGLVNTADTAQFLMKTAEWQPSRRITLAEAVSADERYRVALASALGEAANYFVVETAQEAASAIAALKNANKGKATFICLERVPMRDAPATSALPYLSEVVNVSNEAPHSIALRNVLRNTLGGMVCAESPEAAREAVEQGLCEAAVSPDGAIFRKNGQIKGGGTNPTEGAAIGRTEQIETLKQEISALQTQIAELRATITEKTALRKELSPNRLADALRQAEAAKSKHEQALGQLRFQVESLEEALDQKQNDIDRFVAEMRALEEAQAAESAQGNEVEELVQRKHAAEDHLAAMQKALADVEEELASRTDEARTAEMQLVELRGEHRSLASSVERLEAEISSLEERSHKREEEAIAAQAEHDALEERFSTMEAELSLLQSEATSAEAVRDGVAAEQAEIRLQIQRESEETRSVRREAEAVTTRLHKGELDLTNLQNRLEAARERATEEFAIDLTTFQSPEALEESALSDNATLFEDEKFDLSRLKNEAKSLKEQIKSIGTVNPLAAEEYDRESARLEFLENQFKDLQESEHTLRQTIQEINNTAQKQFYDVFERIRTNFIHIFKTLFNEGDEADLQIEEGDPLEAPIKIIAKPRGKRPASIEMLSGGEKTLTAIALLFAIYLVKPSPFCILDEVDAPLDDANIGRYVNLIRTFSETTQFIMITHNKLTMEAADTLYGVTMQEEGVSKLVSVQFGQYLGNGNFAEEKSAKNGKAVSALEIVG
ncbi:MAG: chromosome segregation protein SMC [Candidatus Kapabacteria bacterium]|jgi:chromosome segregation protein|nr:chromosome segregation protein SMC [Candidatus Kapabacteria bacterium]